MSRSSARTMTLVPRRRLLNPMGCRTAPPPGGARLALVADGRATDDDFESGDDDDFDEDDDED